MNIASFKAEYLANDRLVKNQKYFMQLNIDDYAVKQIQDEIEKLYDLILGFNDELISCNYDYLYLLYSKIIELAPVEEEASLLETLVPFWQQIRGSQLSREKAIDEFYYEFEMLKLWVLICDAIANNEFSADLIRKMRAIIRRYSNMPQLWLFLCRQSGEEIKTSFTF